jgi:ribulose-bisphosphate carboxylase large chain
MTGKRFSVVYQIVGDEATAWEQAQIISLEQTVEVGEELVPAGLIRDHIVGQIEQFSAEDPGSYVATISYAIETSAFELTQLLNVIFGNSSIKAGLKVKHLMLGEDLLSHFSGPRFGMVGLRQLVGVFDKPLLCTALKPMGKTPAELAELAYQLAVGGIDVIKDDHGLTNQPFCPYEARVEACAAAVAKANQQTGKQCLYVPNITAPAPLLMARVNYAKQQGAGGLLIAPGLTGFDTLRTLAEDNQVNLPLISHPALLGSSVIHPDNGFSHAVLFGQLQRLAGADASIYPNYGGRFGFSQAECQSIAVSCQEPMGTYLPILPTPGGGMTLEKVPEMLDVYGHEVMFLIGGALYSRSSDLVDNVRYFLSLVGRQ